MKSLADYLDLAPEEKPLPNAKVDDFMPRVFGYVESITYTKQYLMVNEEEEKFYQKARFMIHRALSQSFDVLPILNLVNQHYDMPVKMEYNILMSEIPARMRRGKWAKKSPKSLYMDTIREYYGYTEQKAEEVMKLLSVEDMMMIEQKTKKQDQVINGGYTCQSSGDTESK
jgi:hypothetical protein